VLQNKATHRSTSKLAAHPNPMHGAKESVALAEPSSWSVQGLNEQLSGETPKHNEGNRKE